MSNICLALFVDSSPIIPWSVTSLQVAHSFLELFNQLRAGRLEYFSEYLPKLSNCRLVKTFVGQEKLNLIAVDSHLQIDEVCKQFGYFVRFNCTRDDTQQLPANQPTPQNAFKIMMEAQKNTWYNLFNMS